MSNHGDNISLHIFQIMEDGVDETCLEDIFNIDSDYLENEEYFREDTVGTEAKRCAKELYDNHKDIKDPEERLQAMLDDIPGYSNGMQAFFIGNSTYCGDYKIDLSKYEATSHEWMFIVTIAYVS